MHAPLVFWLGLIFAFAVSLGLRQLETQRILHELAEADPRRGPDPGARSWQQTVHVLPHRGRGGVGWPSRPAA